MSIKITLPQYMEYGFNHPYSNSKIISWGVNQVRDLPCADPYPMQ